MMGAVFLHTTEMAACCKLSCMRMHVSETLESGVSVSLGKPALSSTHR